MGWSPSIAMPWGLAPTGNRETSPVRVSIRTISDVDDTATHTAPEAIARPLGSSPTGMTARTLLVMGSIRETVPSRVFATQIASAVATTVAGPLPT